MKTAPGTLIGFAIGVGLVFVATAGVYWTFWRPSDPLWMWAGGSFAVGALVGALVAATRKIEV
jgi:hypothetical protein